ncbi:Uncharacterized protein HZ326_6646 [Fusarium oxysporum f. sp. albedinis]|nr:Uncharacterized protein HZ326_6646 [Fusarium oxysporum f. sp. albedinis]
MLHAPCLQELLAGHQDHFAETHRSWAPMATSVLGEEGSSSLWARGNVEGPSRWTGPPSRPLERRTKAGLLECLQASRELKSPGLLLISTWASWATISTGSVRPSTEPKQKPQPEKTVSTATPTYTNQRL